MGGAPLVRCRSEAPTLQHVDQQVVEDQLRCRRRGLHRWPNGPVSTSSRRTRLGDRRGAGAADRLGHRRGHRRRVRLGQHRLGGGGRRCGCRGGGGRRPRGRERQAEGVPDGVGHGGLLRAGARRRGHRLHRSPARPLEPRRGLEEARRRGPATPRRAGSLRPRSGRWATLAQPSSLSPRHALLVRRPGDLVGRGAGHGHAGRCPRSPSSPRAAPSGRGSRSGAAGRQPTGRYSVGSGSPSASGKPTRRSSSGSGV